MSFPPAGTFPGAGSGPGGDLAGMTEQEQMIVKSVRECPISFETIFFDVLSDLQMHVAMESCAGKTVMSGVMGFAIGGAFGLFMSSVCLPRLVRV